MVRFRNTLPESIKLLAGRLMALRFSQAPTALQETRCLLQMMLGDATIHGNTCNEPAVQLTLQPFGGTWDVIGILLFFFHVQLLESCFIYLSNIV